MKLTLNYSKDVDAWTLLHEDVIIRTEEDAAEWRRQIIELYRDKHDGYLLIDLAGFDLDPALMDTYGKTAKEITYSHWKSVIRYGGDNAFSEAAMRIKAIDNKYPSYIFPDREA